MEEKNLNNNNNNTNEWLCKKCQNKNTFDHYRCSKCNYFEYDVYAGNYKNQNIKKKVKKESKPIILEDNNNIDYNYKEDYEFNREERHKFTKCWNCGWENIYYKVKCNYCKFPINDNKEPKVKKTQLTQYDILHGITFDNTPKKIKENNKYREIEIKYNPFKEDKKYNNLTNIWNCKYCNKKNTESIKFCSFCYKNRL